MKKMIVLCVLFLASISSYASNSLSALNTEKFLKLNEVTATLTSVCRDNIDQERIERKCLNNLLLPMLLDKWALKESLSSLKAFLGEDNNGEIYLEEIEADLKLNSNDKTSLNKNEMNQIVFSLINIESIFHDYDRDQSNKLDIDELIKLFEFYRTDFISSINIKPESEKYAQSLFIFLATTNSNLKQFDQIKYLSFYNCLSISICKKQINNEATRIQLAQLLSITEKNSGN